MNYSLRNYSVIHSVTGVNMREPEKQIRVAEVEKRCYIRVCHHFRALQSEIWEMEGSIGDMEMSAVMEKVQGVQKNTKELKPRQVWIVGRCMRVRRHESFFYTVVICPAADAYSKPQVVEFRSKARFAEKDEECQGVGEIGGYEGKSYQVVDRETGERKTLQPVNMYLDLVE